MTAEIDDLLEKACTLYPHPIAVACGRILRSRNLVNRLDAILRAGEALTRYTAALALASLAAQEGEHFAAPDSLLAFDGNLSWGHFLDVIQQVSAHNEFEHPLKQQIVTTFQPNNQGIASAGDPLASLLKLRNELGHDLQAVGETKAQVIFRNGNPDQLLTNSLRALHGLLNLPLFLIEDQRFVQRQFTARQLMLMGESDNPVPEDVTLKSGLDEVNVLYVGIKSGVLNLWPWLTWDLAEQRVTYAVFVIHAIQKHIKYKSMFSDDIERNSKFVQGVADRRAGLAVPVEQVELADGRSFLAEWIVRRKAMEQSLLWRGSSIPWSDLDLDTLRWYASRLHLHNDTTTEERTAIQVALLDGRDILQPNEVNQILLLFGTDKAIRQLIRRDLLDCRARQAPETRWSDRQIINLNVIESLRMAVLFFGKHVGIEGVTLDGLIATSGTADYVAMREALVNLFIHQDYTDERTPAQIELTAERAMFFNAGKSLVNVDALVEGGKTQSRNPLISRALRLIGFAELAGSGLRAVQQVWREAKRRPPRFESNPSANTFTLTLDWRILPQVVDSFWQQRIGVRVSPQQATLLSLLVASSGFTEVEIASGSGFLLTDVRSDLDYLKLQSLVTLNGNRYCLSSHLRPLVEPVS